MLARGPLRAGELTFAADALRMRGKTTAPGGPFGGGLRFREQRAMSKAVAARDLGHVWDFGDAVKNCHVMAAKGPFRATRLGHLGRRTLSQTGSKYG